MKQCELIHLLYSVRDVCPLCNERLILRKGKYGLFLGCSHYPNCFFTVPEFRIIKDRKYKLAVKRLKRKKAENWFKYYIK